MAEENDKIKELSDKLDILLSKHNSVSNEIDGLRVQITQLIAEQKQAPSDKSINEITSEPLENYETKIENENSDIEDVVKIEFPEENQQSTDKSTIEADRIEKINQETEQELDYFQSRRQRTAPRPKETKQKPIPLKNKFNIEKLIGENLLGKIGILILIVGVVVGARLSIEKGLISPLARIMLGYVVGIVLLGFGMKLKQKYLNFSAVLVSGAMAICYFITFFAFDFYHLIGQNVAFGMMVFFTIFTVLAALNYNKQIIAHFGLVGAIAVPFLLSNNSGNVVFLFSYLALINIGIAYISLKKNWLGLFFSAFALTWVIFGTWMMSSYEYSDHFEIAILFLCIFFVLFYIIFIAYKFINSEKYNSADVIILLFNSIIFFSIGYSILYNHEIGGQLLGVFAIGNAAIHLIVAFIVNRRKLADRNLFYFIIGLVVVCLTLAIPIQLDGHWVTMMWSGEAAVLFMIGRRRNVSFYEYLSFGLLLIAGLSLAHDWYSGYYSIPMMHIDHLEMENRFIKLFFNSLFLSSLAVIISLGIINWGHFNKTWKAKSKINDKLMQFIDYVLPIILILAIYFAIRLELKHYFGQVVFGSTNYSNSEPGKLYNYIYNDSIVHSSSIWLLNYSMLFFTLIATLINKKLKQPKAIWGLIGLNILIILTFMTQGLYELSELRDNYINQHQVDYYNLDSSFMWLRYLSIGCLALLIYCTYLLLKKVNKSPKIYAIAEILFYLVILWLSSSELIHWLGLSGKKENYGLVLSIFSGIFSVIIIVIGIWKKKKHLRILGIAIFTVTLAKLFFYDLSHLSTIDKTIVMISLGALLLLTSFLYNKYTIEDEEEI